MDNGFKLEWIIRSGDTRGNKEAKVKLTSLILDSIFSSTIKDGWKRLCPSLSLYYDPEKTTVGGLKKSCAVSVFNKDHSIIVIPDSVVEDAFVVILYQIGSYDAYRSYTNCTIKGDKYIINSIPDFDGSIAPYSIIYSNSDECATYRTWNFDCRNYLDEILVGGLLVIYVNHRDPYFNGCATIHCHDTNNSKRWMYVSVSSPHYISLSSKFYVKNKILTIGDFTLDLDVTHITSNNH